MATLRQKALARAIINAVKNGDVLKAGALLETAGYSKATARATSGRTIAQKGVQDELQVAGFDVASAMNVVQDVMHDKKTPGAVKIMAADKVFKVKGAYAPEKKEISGTLSLSTLLGDDQDDDEGLIPDAPSD